MFLLKYIIMMKIKFYLSEHILLLFINLIKISYFFFFFFFPTSSIWRCWSHFLCDIDELFLNHTKISSSSRGMLWQPQASNYPNKETQKLFKTTLRIILHHPLRKLLTLNKSGRIYLISFIDMIPSKVRGTHYYNSIPVSQR